MGEMKKEIIHKPYRNNFVSLGMNNLSGFGIDKKPFEEENLNLKKKIKKLESRVNKKPKKGKVKQPRVSASQGIKVVKGMFGY